MNFSYAHCADLHLGAWRDPMMRDLSTKAFLMAMDDCSNRKVDFILFAGDLFNTSLPSLDTLKIVVAKLKELKDSGIPVYAIAGSHDFSPSGKTMLDVLENAGLLTNVCKGSVNPETKELHLRFTTDPKTGVKMTGIIGRKGMLDRTYYENLARTPLEQETGYKIFLFHTTIAELLPQHLAIINSQPISLFPKNCNYYAGGHIHHPTKIVVPEYGTVTYPGALFPNNFAEVEKYGTGGYYIITVNNQHQEVEWISLPVIKQETVTLQCSHQSAEEISAHILKHFQDKDLTDTLITVRLKGTLTHGTASAINFKTIFKQLYAQKAYFIMKNTAALVSKEFAEIKTSNSNQDNVEEEIIKEHLQQIKLFSSEKELQLINSLLLSLNTTKKEGETVNDFQQRIESDLHRILEY